MLYLFLYNMSMNNKYGLFSYDTNNIGDEIQSIAARRFLPRVDFYINRDFIDGTKALNAKKTKVIMNGWYMSPSQVDNKIHWPPQTRDIDPLLISMHIDALNKTTDVFATDESKRYLTKFGPVGCRDIATYNFLESIDVPAYFSGCLTLTLLPDKNVKKRDWILAVDVPDEVYEKIKSTTQKPVFRLDAARAKDFSNSEKFCIAEIWLFLYQTASCVVTQRLHTILPCLALGTPVIALKGRDPQRYSGLIELANTYSIDDFLKKTPDLDNPIANPTKHCMIAKDLATRCAEYTGFDSKKSYLNGKTVEELLTSVDFINVLSKTVSAHEKYDLIAKDLATAQQRIARLELELSPGIKKSISLLNSAIKRRLSK